MRVTVMAGTQYETVHHITRTDPHRHKYDGPIAEYLDIVGDLDWRGGVDEPTGAYAAAGRKRIMFNGERGDVWCERFDDQHARDQVLEALDFCASIWVNEECDEQGRPYPDDDDGAAWTAAIARGERYVAYVVRCVEEGCDAFDVDGWTLHGRPDGPIGGAPAEVQ